MKAKKTKQLIYEYTEIAFGNRERNNKRLHDMHQFVADEIAELERIATEYESNKHYIDLGKAVEKAFEEKYTLTKTPMKFISQEIKDTLHLLKWYELMNIIEEDESDGE